jgi:predicted lipoprotein
MGDGSILDIRRVGMLRIDRIVGACGVTAALVVSMFLGTPAWAETAKPTAPSAATKPAVSAPEATAKNKWAKKKVVSPYARAASQREHAGQAPIGHAPTMVQGIGKPRKPHAGTPSK